MLKSVAKMRMNFASNITFLIITTLITNDISLFFTPVKEEGIKIAFEPSFRPQRAGKSLERVLTEARLH